MLILRAVLIILETVAQWIKMVRINKVKNAINQANKKDQKAIDELNDLADR